VSNRLRNLTAVTPETTRAARVVALVAMGLAAFVVPLRIFLIAAVVAGAVPGVAAGVVRLLGAPLLFAVLGGATWLWMAGSYSPVRDVLLLSAITLAALLLSHEWRQWWSRECAGQSPRLDLRANSQLALVVLTSFWLASSAIDVWARQLIAPVPGSIDRFHSLSARPSRFPGKTAAVALSGGGYRAALVHAGVLYALDDLGVRISAISAVSGGSIVGTYYATGGSPLEFLRIVQRRAYGLAREVTRAPAGARMLIGLFVNGTPLDRVRWLRYDRTDAQAALVDRLFLHGVRLADLGDDARPRLMLGTTDTLTGRTLGFTPQGVYAHNVQSLFFRTSIDGNELSSARQSEWIPPLSRDVWQQPAARFVAASGAFPGALEPVRETLIVRRRNTDDLSEDVRLADGGLTDNTGLTLLLVALTGRRPPDFITGYEAWKPWTADVVIASDGGRALEPSDGPSGLLQDVGRTADIVYATAGLRFVPDKSRPAPPPLTLLTPAEPAFRGRRWVREGNPLGCEMLMHGPRREGQSADDELKAALEAFQRTPTLADRLDPEDARLLFRLGQFLVARSWSGIWYDLDGSPESRAHIGPNWREVQERSPCNKL
jgi:predicted acylesterase/phospholipase RssA